MIEIVHQFIKENPRSINWTCSANTKGECCKVSTLLVDYLEKHGIKATLIFGKEPKFELETSSNKKVIAHYAIYIPKFKIVIDLTGAQFGYEQVFMNLEDWKNMWSQTTLAKNAKFNNSNNRFINWPEKYPLDQ